jgi:uncharacterized protein
MTRLRRAIALFALPAALLPLASAAAQRFPPPQGYVSDFAGIISPGVQGPLEEALRQFEQEKETTVEIAVVTVPGLGNETIETYAVGLFEQWGIGKKNVDNGVLLLFDTQSRRVRIEVGYGMEPYITDGKAGQILDTYFVPDRAAGNIERGLVATARAIAQAVRDSDYESGSIRARPPLEQAGDYFSRHVWWFVALGIPSIYAFAYMARSKSIWLGGIWGVVVGLVSGILADGWPPIVLGIIIGGILGLVLDLILSNAYRFQTSSGHSTSWGSTWGGFYGGGGGYRGGGGGFGGFGGGRSGGGGASR